MNFLRSLSPVTLDNLAAGKSGVLAMIWRTMRSTFIDRLIYWGVALTVILPLAFWLVGASSAFAVSGGLIGAVAVAGGYWLYAFVSSVVIGVASLFAIGKNRMTVVRRVQKAGFFVAAVAFLLGGSLLFPAVLTVTALGAVVGALLLTAIAEWSIGSGCSGGSCEIPTK